MRDIKLPPPDAAEAAELQALLACWLPGEIPPYPGGLYKWAENAFMVQHNLVGRQRDLIDKLVGALQMAKHLVDANGTQEQLDQVFEALEAAGVKP